MKVTKCQGAKRTLAKAYHWRRDNQNEKKDTNCIHTVVQFFVIISLTLSTPPMLYVQMPSRHNIDKPSDTLRNERLIRKEMAHASIASLNSRHNDQVFVSSNEQRRLRHLQCNTHQHKEAFVTTALPAARLRRRKPSHKATTRAQKAQSPPFTGNNRVSHPHLRAGELRGQRPVHVHCAVPIERSRHARRRKLTDVVIQLGQSQQQKQQ